MSTLEQEREYWDALAAHYHQDVITPFDPEVDFRLGRDVRKVLRGWRRDSTLGRRVVFDFGCGIGESLELVAGQAGLAAGIDFSEGMLDESQWRLEQAGIDVHRINGASSLRRLRLLAAERPNSADAKPTTVLARGNLLRLRALERTCDLALAINSTSQGSLAQAHRMLDQIIASLRPGGHWLAVFPSLDNVDYLHRLYSRHGLDSAGLGRVSSDGRMYIHDNGERQKFFTPEELLELCRSHQLTVQRLEKIRYPWKLIARYGWGHFPRSPRMWDWYLSARKRTT